MKSLDITAYGRDGLAAYACHADDSKGRLFDEPGSPTRTHFQRDRDRIIHSTAFRRLKHKTQVFVHHVGDHYRTRLTHSIEVSQIARSLARALQVDEDLAESLALSHDFGHTPFGHVGEDILNELMLNYGGFDHNAQSLRIVTMLEQQYAEFDGLNLCWETLEGLVKHNGPVKGNIPQTFIDFNEIWDLELASHASLEAQCAAVADDIAYNAHDLDDGLRAKLFSLADLTDVPLAGTALNSVRTQYPELEDHRIRHEIVRRQITAMVEDVITNAKANLARLAPQTTFDVRHCGETIVCFSDNMQKNEKGIKTFLFDKMYRSPDVMKMRDGAETIIRDLFDIYLNETDDMPNGLQRLSMKNKSNDRPRIIADFIAGMTDSYAISEHERLFDATPDLG